MLDKYIILNRNSIPNSQTFKNKRKIGLIISGAFLVLSLVGILLVYQQPEHQT